MNNERYLRCIITPTTLETCRPPPRYQPGHHVEWSTVKVPRQFQEADELHGTVGESFVEHCVAPADTFTNSCHLVRIFFNASSLIAALIAFGQPKLSRTVSTANSINFCASEGASCSFGIILFLSGNQAFVAKMQLRLVRSDSTRKRSTPRIDGLTFCGLYNMSPGALLFRDRAESPSGGICSQL